MGPLEQIAAVLAAPFSLARLRWRSLGLLLLYVLCAATLLGLLGWFLVSHESDLRKVFLAYILPESWRFAGDVLVRQFLATQTKSVLVNATVSGTLVLISILLFPLKEKVSASYERDAALTSDTQHEFPLWFQALEEVKLLLVFLSAQMIIFWLGYHPSPWRKHSATALSFAYLFCTFSIDFISPLLQRHRLRYSQIIKGLLRHPLLLFGFGALFMLTPVIAGLYVAHHRADLPLRDAVLLLFGCNLVVIVWGVVAGTWIASRLLSAVSSVKRTPAPLRAVAWLLLLATFGVNSYVFGSVARSVHHKSQILKCGYSVVPGSLAFDAPRLGALFRKTVDLGVRFELEIDNPTPFDVAVERNRLEVRHGKTLLATAKLAPMAIPSREKRRQPLDLRLKLRARELLRLRSQLLSNRYSVVLYLEVAPGVELPVYLSHAVNEALKKRRAKRGKK